ncbi:rhomboid family intramembrane serine protease [Vagococcus coleopterorum]|uniref:Rhomboid family intramembrane serine protease n=1 Tax=Vagococcus coleopterorum TaxID=2714946 RepID=A0A6G8AMW9_9ENTE|nr:rhomboid family intramembrane serine protease [Vagococcus coleopterorum]QIL46273.1 rhomboid family intramembrane serine protease [Vagococcus coleopterorum]
MNLKNNRYYRQFQRSPWITWTLLGIQCLIFVLMTVDGIRYGIGFDGTKSIGLLLKYGAMNQQVVMETGEFWRFIMPIFIHIGWLHLLVNSMTLYFIGFRLEGLIGHWRFLCVYLLSGIAGNLASFAFSSPATVSAGASTALFGMFAYFYALGKVYPHHPQISFMAKQMGTLIAVNLFFNLFSSQIDMWGHIGGAIGGFLLGFIVGIPKLRNSQFQSSRIDRHSQVRASIALVFLLAMCFLYVYRLYTI